MASRDSSALGLNLLIRCWFHWPCPTPLPFSPPPPSIIHGDNSGCSLGVVDIKTRGCIQQNLGNNLIGHPVHSAHITAAAKPINVDKQKQNTVFLVAMLILGVASIFISFAAMAICYRFAGQFAVVQVGLECC